MDRKKTGQETTQATDIPNSSLAIGGITKPQQMTEVFIRQGLLVPPELKGLWVLWGELSADMFDKCFATDVARPLTHVSYCRTSNGGNYLVITHQAAARQHRFVLPLWDEGVLEGVRAMRDGRLRFMLVRSSGRDAVVLPVDFKQSVLDPALVKAAPSDPEVLETLFMEMPGMLQSMRQLDAIPGCVELGNVSEVAVSVVPPVQAVGHFVDAMT